MICPKCGCPNVSSTQKMNQKVNVKVNNHNGCLWFILFGWIYLLYKCTIWLCKAAYFLLIGWWVAMIKHEQKKIEANAVVHICQHCGNRWETK